MLFPSGLSSDALSALQTFPFNTSSPVETIKYKNFKKSLMME